MVAIHVVVEGDTLMTECPVCRRLHPGSLALLGSSGFHVQIVTLETRQDTNYNIPLYGVTKWIGVTGRTV